MEPMGTRYQISVEKPLDPRIVDLQPASVRSSQVKALSEDALNVNALRERVKGSVSWRERDLVGGGWNMNFIVIYSGIIMDY